MSIAFGLDFGTTNSVLAIAQNGNVEIVDIDPSSVSQKTLKSVLFFDEEGSISIGQEAIDQYVSYGCLYGRLMQSIKAFLPSKSSIETYIFGKRYEIEDLISLILKVIKHRGELHVGHVVDTVIMGRPVVFSEDKELISWPKKDCGLRLYVPDSRTSTSCTSRSRQHLPMNQDSKQERKNLF